MCNVHKTSAAMPLKKDTIKCYEWKKYGEMEQKQERDFCRSMMRVVANNILDNDDDDESFFLIFSFFFLFL